MAVGRSEDAEKLIAHFLDNYFNVCGEAGSSINSLRHVSYFLAYRLIPELAHRRWNEFVQLWEPGIPFSTYIALSGSLILKTSINAEQLNQFKQSSGSLNDTTRYYMMEFPEPPPFSDDEFNKSIEIAIKAKTGELQNNSPELSAPTLGPYYACVLQNTLTNKRDVYVLGQRIGGHTTLRRIIADGGNENCGYGPAPTVKNFLSCLEKAVTADQVFPLSRSPDVARDSTVSQFCIGGFEFCKPDYQQIMLWAKALKLEPEVVLERLLTEPQESWQRQHKTQIEHGRIIKLGWDIGLLPLKAFEWVGDLVIRSVIFFVPVDQEPAHISMTLRLPELQRLSCDGMGLTKLDLSNVPMLTELYCDSNKLTDLDLSRCLNITDVSCGNNLISALDIASAPQLKLLSCNNNRIRNIDLSSASQLYYLVCNDNHLTALDLSAVSQLSVLTCYNNPITDLDIRSLTKLTVLHYDQSIARLIQRPDQNF